MDKVYEATVHLGVETVSHDPEGEVVAENPGWEDVGAEELEAALAGLRGKISQKPPAYSAKKVQGEAAHRRVRRGEEVELKPVAVEVHDLKVLGVDLPRVRLGVRCSSGTYIRALARDLGRSLNVGGHLSTLRRTEIGPFSGESAANLDALSAPEDIQANLIPSALALAHFPAFHVGQEDAVRVCRGQALPLTETDSRTELPPKTPVRVLLDGDLLAVAVRVDDQLRPRKVLNDVLQKVMAHG